MTGGRAGIPGAVVLLAAAALVAPAAPKVTSADLGAQDGAPPGSWPRYGGDAGATRYSPLDQVDASNAADLRIAWRWQLRNFGPRPETKAEVTPLAVGGRLYATAGTRRAVVALDAATGETLWMHRVDEGERGARAPRKGSGRGVAWWSDGAGDDRIFYVTPGYRLVALDADTGYPVEGFGAGGVVDLMALARGDVDPLGAIGNSSPPLVVGDVVVVGPALEVGLRPPSADNVPGDVHAFDARDGRRLWTFHTVPRQGEVGSETWEGGPGAAGNAGVWAPMSADTARGLVYLPVEAATNDVYGGHRPGDNLFSSSLVCLDARTGRRVWHRQIVHHDIWDFDNPTAPILADLVVDGRPVEAVVQLTKQAFAYVFDRVTGEPVWPLEERPVPASDVPGERASPTQPIPTRPPAFDRQGVTEDDLVDFTPALRTKALEVVGPFRLGTLFQPPSRADDPDGTHGTLALPGTTGGANWEGGAFDPRTGMLYVASYTSPSVLALVHDPEASSADWILAPRFPLTVEGIPVVKPPWGRITAIDLNRGELAWQVPNGDTPREIAEHPALEGVELPRTGKPTRAGLLVTRTLLFAGEGWGGDPVLHVLDKATGREVARLDLPASTSGLPMTYAVDGWQYVVVAVGGPGQPAELVALALPGQGR